MLDLISQFVHFLSVASLDDLHFLVDDLLTVGEHHTASHLQIFGVLLQISFEFVLALDYFKR